MKQDITPILQDWHYALRELRVRKIDGGGGQAKVQIRMDLGLMQLEWQGRPDASRPHDHTSLLDYYQGSLRASETAGEGEAFSLSRDDCWALAQEAIQYYWRRICFFELKEYARAEADADHNLAILDLCEEFAECEEDQQMAGQHRAFVMAHRTQARALALLEAEDYDRALQRIRAGIAEVEGLLAQRDVEVQEEPPELQFLREWESEVERARPLSPAEQLGAELQVAVEQEKYEQAASLRDQLRAMSASSSAGSQEF